MEASKIRANHKIILNWEPYVVVKYNLRQQPRLAAKMITKLKNLLTWTTIEKTFTSWEDIEEADIELWKAQYLYNSWTDYVFMDNETFEQFEFSEEKLWDQAKFLKDWMEVWIMKWNWNAINIELPPSIEVEIIEAEPWVKWDSATWATKKAKIETWAEITVPLFIESWEKVIVNTQTWEYISRAK